MNKKMIMALSLSALLFTACGNAIGEFTDRRDGKTYKTVKIGEQTWMAENLNYEKENSFCYNNDADNCTKFGRLYTWRAATGACPTGWHLPSMEEFEKLIVLVGGEDAVSNQKSTSKKLRSTSDWDDDRNGSDNYGFSILPAGLFVVSAIDDDPGSSQELGRVAYLWSSTEKELTEAFNLRVAIDYYKLYDRGLFNKNMGYSVRCVKDSN